MRPIRIACLNVMFIRLFIFPCFTPKCLFHHASDFLQTDVELGDMTHGKPNILVFGVTEVEGGVKEL